MLNLTTPTIDELVLRANDFYRRGDYAHAEPLYRQILHIHPQHPEALHLLGLIVYHGGKFDAAIQLLSEAVKVSPDDAVVHNNLANAYKDAKRFDEAIAHYQRSLELDPNYAVALNNMGQSLHALGRYDEAKKYLLRAIAAAPELAVPHRNLGQLYHDEGKIEDAGIEYEKALALDPRSSEIRFNLGYIQLMQGKFENGWKNYDQRWNCNAFRKDHPYLATPQWNGELLGTRTLLLHSEQGFGDAIQFIRYLPMVTQAGGKVLLACPPELKRFFSENFPSVPCYSVGDKLPAYDVQSPLLSLPRIFATLPDTIPDEIPYLKASPERVQRWKEKLSHDGPGLKVGISWAGRSTHLNDINRSIPYSIFSRLLQTPGVRFYSLQKNVDPLLLRDAPPIDHTAELTDFAETAAFVSALDLVICVDTAIAHLAGALGKKVWLLLPFVPDWRWQMKRGDSAWYPGMELYRQHQRGDWPEVIGRVGQDLADEAKPS